jgi:hypothetical protein
LSACRFEGETVAQTLARVALFYATGAMGQPSRRNREASLFLAAAACNIGSLRVGCGNDALYSTFSYAPSIFVTEVPLRGVSVALKTQKLKPLRPGSL